eukprot:scaffold193783_cov25-Prasinocladus_malaysianus.AAC.2
MSTYYMQSKNTIKCELTTTLLLALANHHVARNLAYHNNDARKTKAMVLMLAARSILIETECLTIIRSKELNGNLLTSLYLFQESLKYCLYPSDTAHELRASTSQGGTTIWS